MKIFSFHLYLNECSVPTTVLTVVTVIMLFVWEKEINFISTQARKNKINKFPNSSYYEQVCATCKLPPFFSEIRRTNGYCEIFIHKRLRPVQKGNIMNHVSSVSMFARLYSHCNITLYYAYIIPCYCQFDMYIFPNTVS
jgi:hypothetical protein